MCLGICGACFLVICLLGLPTMTWSLFFEPFLERFRPYNLKDQMYDKFDYSTASISIVF